MLWNRSYIIAMYSREAVIALLDARHLWYELTEHRAVNTMEEAMDLTLPYPEREAKNLFLHDDRRRSWHLVSIMGGRRLDLKAFRKEEGLRPLSFASPDELMEHLGLTPGSVTPFGVLNDEARSVVLHLDLCKATVVAAAAFLFVSGGGEFLQNTGCAPWFYTDSRRRAVRPVSRNPCDLSQQTPPYRRQEPAGATGVLQEAGNLFMPVSHLLQNYSELYQSISFECLSVC